MREILFRGRRIDNCEWVEGGLDTDWGLPYSKRHRYYISIPYFDAIQIDPATVGQYTGLLDRLGKKIFEGDIVQIYNVYGERTNCHGVVLWANHDQAYVVCKGNNENMRYGDLGNYTDGKLLEVIGNIHDNPALQSMT